MAPCSTARLRRGPQISRVHKANVLVAFAQPFCERTHLIRRTVRKPGFPWLRMCLLLCFFIDRRILRRSRRNTNARIATVTIGTSQTNRPRRMHGRLIRVHVATNATGIFVIDFSLGLSDQTVLLRLGMRIRCCDQPEHKPQNNTKRANSYTIPEATPPRVFADSEQHDKESSDNSL